MNVAGLTRPTSFLETSEEEYDLVLDVNLKGTFLTTQAAVPAMMERGAGQLSRSLQYQGKEAVAFLVHPPTARPKPELWA